MKDHFIDECALTAKFDGESRHLDDPKSSTVMRCETVRRLVVGLQDKLPFCIQRHAMGRRAALENTDALRAEIRVRTVAGSKPHEHDILHRTARVAPKDLQCSPPDRSGK